MFRASVLWVTNKMVHAISHKWNNRCANDFNEVKQNANNKDAANKSQFQLQTATILLSVKYS
jgi:hypothetical protein